MDDDAEPAAHTPVPVSLLADLQAGLLDDDTAARVRRQIRTDPEAARVVAALDRVRGDLADLGSDAPSGYPPDVPADVTARLYAALAATTPPAAAGPASHAARGSGMRPRTVALVVGGIAALAAVGICLFTLIDTPPRSPSAGVTADRITVSRAPTDFPGRQDELLALLDRPADLGPLADPTRRAACLSALGFPGSAAVLGADTVDIDGQPVILLLLAGDENSTLTALAVAPTCSADDPGVVAETVLPHATTTP